MGVAEGGSANPSHPPGGFSYMIPLLCCAGGHYEAEVTEDKWEPEYKVFSQVFLKKVCTFSRDS